MISAINNENKYQDAIENFMIPVSLEQRQKDLDEHLERFGYATENNRALRKVQKYYQYSDYRYEQNYALKLPVFASQREAAIFLYQLVEYWLPQDVHFNGVSFCSKNLNFEIVLIEGWDTCTSMLSRIFSITQEEVFKLPFTRLACWLRGNQKRCILEEDLWEFIQGGDK